MKKLSVEDIRALKNKRKITRTTALDFFTAIAIEQAGIDMIGLDGPPVEIFYKGLPSGENATLEELLWCLDAVRRGAQNTFIMVPLPYSCSSLTADETLRTAAKLLENGADAVKLEGAGPRAQKIRKMVGRGIPCVGHIGLDTEKAKTGGFRSIGKTAAEAYEVFEDALELQDCGVVWIELECVPFKVAGEITKRIQVPTIGIGSGPDCDGQFLHCEDMLGMHNRYYPRHCKKYLTVYEQSVKALKKFREEVSQDPEFEEFMKKISPV